MDRLLMLLTASDWSEARECLNSALSQASDPELITVGLYLMREPADDQLTEILQDTRITMRSSGSVWQGIDDVWQGQPYVMAAHPGMRFSLRWDRSLQRALRRCVRMSGFNTLLTGMLPRDVEPVDAVCAVAADRIDRLDRLYLTRGTPLRYAGSPVPGAFVNPEFCYAPAGFFRMMAMQEMPIFLAAGEQRWQIYTLHRPVIHLQWEEELQPIDLRPWRESEAMKRFETRSRFRVEERHLPPRLKTGIMTFDLTFETHVPRMVKLQEAMRTLDSCVSPLKPMCVTCWLTLPGEPLDEMRMTRFRRLSSMRRLPLLCYTDPPNAAALSRSHGQVVEYQGHYGLQAPLSAIRKDLVNYTRLCKPYLLARTRQRELKYSHYIWLDLDYLRYPVYERCALDWQNVCRDRIVVALVDGRPDLSMISVPEQRLEPLCRQIDGYVQHELAQCTDPSRSGLPQQENLWIRLMAEHPDWFEPVTLPGRRELLAIAMLGRGEEFHTT